MALPIIEQPLYGEMLIETSPWATPFVWTDRTASLVAGFNYSQGGRVGTPGSSQVDVGTLNATFKDLASVPAVGALVRISFSKFAGYAFVGYIENVSQRVVFDNSISLTTPVTLTTLHCVDWVGYISQFQAVGVGAVNTTSGAVIDSSYYAQDTRVAALNKIMDPSFSAKIISTVFSGTLLLGDTDLVGTIAQHLDLVAVSAQTYWYPINVIPTNTTTGRTGLIGMRRLDQSPISSGYTFTDLAGTAGQLHYTEIDIENSTANIANTIVINNRARGAVIGFPGVTQIGGFNETNFMVINDSQVVGIALDHVEKATDTTSITTYGNRQSEFDACVSYGNVAAVNYVNNPSVEYSDNGYFAGVTSNKVRRRKPSEDPNPFSAYSGQWAIRSRQATANATPRIGFNGGESDGVYVDQPGLVTNTFYAYAARGTVSRVDMRAQARIDWYDDNEALISSTTGSNVSLTNANQWYAVSASAVPPANAVRATLNVIYNRSGGGNVFVNDNLWADAWYFGQGSVGAPAYFDGDSPWNSTYGFTWSGGVGTSSSISFGNSVDTLATALLTKYSTTSLRVSRIRWNAQEQLSAIPSLSVGKTLSIVYKGTTTTHRIIGIDASVDPERYMIDYYLQKV